MKTVDRLTKGRVRSELNDVVRRMVQTREMSDADLMSSWHDCFPGSPEATPTREEAIRGIAISALYHAMNVLNVE